MVHTASHTTASSMTPAYAMLPSAVMLLLLMHLLLLQSGSGFAQTGNEPPSMVTSGATCLSDADCPKNRYCQPDSMRCLVRIGEKGECDILGADGECAEGLHCTFGESYRESRCLPQGDMGDICRVDATQPCKAGLLCDADTARCRESNATPDGDEQQHDGGGDDSLLRNDPCVRDEDCGARQRAGFFCAPGGRCVRRRPEGAQCRDHAQCIGFCAGSDGAAGGNGMCRPHQAVGAACGANDHCAHVGAVPARYAVLCNMPEDGTKGVCLSANQLLRALGTTCNPNKDACDARRGLSCQRVGSASFGRFACVQRGQRSAMYCAPAGKKGSEFSGCPLALETGVPATCRRTRAPMRPGFFRCLRRVETVPRGAVCSPRGEHVACAEGTTCSAVPGTGVRACVAAVARGADCSNKFATTCADGLACVDGTCVPGAPSTPRQRTHADLGEDCSALPCVPGTRCETSTGKNTKLCALPRVTVVKGKPCYATARFNKVCLLVIVFFFFHFPISNLIFLFISEIEISDFLPNFIIDFSMRSLWPGVC